MSKDMFEQFRDRELPPEIQAHVECAADIHGKNNKKNGGLQPDFLWLKTY